MLPIRIMRLRRASAAARVIVDSTTYNDIRIDPADALAEISFNSSGSATKVGNTGGSNYTWRQLGASADYELRVTPSSGTFSASSGTGSWLALSSSRFYNCSQTIVGEKSCTATFEIRDAVTLVVLATGIVTITATVEI